MEDLIINDKDKVVYIPEVYLRVETGSVLIKGESYMEEPFELYGQINDWIKEYTQEYDQELTVNFELMYVNSSSFRALLDCLREIKRLQEAGKAITVNWRYPEDDVNEIQEEGEDLAFDAEMEINLVAY